MVQDLRATSLTVNTHPRDSLFAKPAGFPELPPAVAGPQVEKLSDRAVAVYGADYNSVAVAFADHVVVLEAGANPRYAAAALAQIKRAFPGKPVRYLVATHWNFDHLGGVRPYIAEGVTILTTPSAKSVIERAAQAPHVMRPDALARQPRDPVFEVVTAPKRVLGDGSATIELYSLSPNPHVDEMLVAYLPAEKVLFEADLFDLEVAGHGGTGGRDTAELLRKVEELGLDVKKIIPVHGVAATMDDLREAVARRTGR
jgi:glyoxylase-like metal-dependent hydrolase (beta-lactamase superfamily II)